MNSQLVLAAGKFRLCCSLSLPSALSELKQQGYGQGKISEWAYRVQAPGAHRSQGAMAEALKVKSPTDCSSTDDMWVINNY